MREATIRNYRAEDLAACRALWVELTERHRQIYGSPEIGGADPGQKFDEHLGRVGAECIWLATVGTEVVGMVGLIPGEHEQEVEPIVVSKGQRGHGIGSRLAQHVVSEARAAGARFLVTRPVARNEDAIRFFHRLGFDALGQVELLLDLRPPGEQRWRPGATIGACDLRV